MTTSNPEYHYSKELFCIRTLSNLHVGSGSENYGVIDNLIQRDAATGFPCIHASSLKGAFREFFKNDMNMGDAFLDHVFGSDKGASETEEKVGETKEANQPKKKTQPGKYRFLQADIVTIPVRAMTQPFVNITCKSALDNIQNLLEGKTFGNFNTFSSKANGTIGDGIQFFQNATIEIETENKELSYDSTDFTAIKLYIGNHPGIVKDETFVEAVSDFGLPVIARNQLNDGKSGNLWYEQVLPRETRLFFFILVPKDDPYFNDFKKHLSEHFVQIGANASVGYGVCQVTHITFTQNPKP